ncbi:MAG: aspartate kinase [Clostridia bacterium]|nr:aspartate kinase [Clostridia bacterium]
MAKVAKFGGSSLADAAQFQKVAQIVKRDPAIRFVVPSAPGKRDKNDEKVTDLLYKSYALACAGQDTGEVFDKIRARYEDIRSSLNLKTDIISEIGVIRERVDAGATIEYTASRGEYLNGLLLAEFLGFEFVDAAEVVFFTVEGVLDAEKTNHVMSKKLAKIGHAVIPGFYGSRPDGSIQTFSRGGSDITGSLVARAASVSIYENWTDVSGFKVADPRIVENAKTIRTITYKELRELSYMGAAVLHQDAVFPVQISGIPINIRNTNEPDDPGTMIVSHLNGAPAKGDTITGIAGHKGYCVITIEKSRMNNELGIGRRFLEIFERHNILFEHLPSGVDTMSVVIAEKAIRGKLESVMNSIQEELQPETMDFIPNVALLAVVGRGMARSVGTAAKLFAALAQAHINIRTIDQGSSEISIIVGVDEENLERSISAIYGAFFSA